MLRVVFVCVRALSCEHYGKGAYGGVRRPAPHGCGSAEEAPRDLGGALQEFSFIDQQITVNNQESRGILGAPMLAASIVSLQNQG